MSLELYITSDVTQSQVFLQMLYHQKHRAFILHVLLANDFSNHKVMCDVSSNGILHLQKRVELFPHTPNFTEILAWFSLPENTEDRTDIEMSSEFRTDNGWGIPFGKIYPSWALSPV